MAAEAEAVGGSPASVPLAPPVKGRLAPSPTGRMHAGNIFAALMAWLVAKAQGGSVVLRMEDLDEQRSRQEHADQLMADLEALGITWDEGPYYQQPNQERYREALAHLQDQGLVYPCFCTRADLHAASAPHRGEKAVYPGTCRNLTDEQRSQRALERPAALRLAVPERSIQVDDLIQGPYGQDLARDCGDFLIRRSDGLFAYQLACVVDDGDQGVNSVVRGVDLLCSTPQQEYLRELLGFGPATYAHVPLLVATDGRRLAKRDHDASLEQLLERYGTPSQVLGHIAHITGLAPEEGPVRPEDLLAVFKETPLLHRFPDDIAIPWR